VRRESLPAAAFEQARVAAANALKLNPKSASAHAALGGIHIFYDWDWTAAEREFQQVTTLAPGSPDALYGDALKQLNAYIAQDPLDAGNFVDLRDVQASRGHLPEAEASVRRALDIRPTFAWGHYYLGLTLLERGDRAAALEEMQRETDDAGKQQGLAIGYYALGRKAESDAALAGMINDQADVNAMGIADVYALRGQSDEAMRWLERAYRQKDASLYYIKSDLPLKSLETDPRYKALLRKMNLPVRDDVAD
jgi:tetratricopeptide (TPR) repeat protein